MTNTYILAAVAVFYGILGIIFDKQKLLAAFSTIASIALAAFAYFGT